MSNLTCLLATLWSCITCLLFYFTFELAYDVEVMNLLGVIEGVAELGVDTMKMVIYGTLGGAGLASSKGFPSHRRQTQMQVSNTPTEKNRDLTPS